MDESLEEYRSYLIKVEQKVQEEFDRTVLSLSGGALGVSFAFVRDVVGPGPVVSTRVLFWSWVCWSVSMVLVLISFFTSHLALRYAVKQVERGEIYERRPGGAYDLLTAICNAFGGFCLSLG